MPNPAARESHKPSRKAAFREKRKKQQQRERIIIISVVAVVVLAIAAILIVPNLPVNIKNLKTPEAITRIQTDGLSVGNPDAPVKVVEYSDFKCSHCYDFWNELESRFVEQYVDSGKVYLTYHPMSFISADSVSAAEASYCASDQGKFWEYHDYLFANFKVSFTDPMLRAIAQAVGLNMNQFDSCYKQGKYTQQVVDDLNSARDKGVTSTPTFDVNGTQVDWGGLESQVTTALGQ